MGGVFRFLTAGESHGEALVAVIDGVPAGLPLTEADINADLAGAMKYGHRDIRNVLERSSARETTARVAVAGVAKRLLAEFGITILSHVTEIGGARIGELGIAWDELARRAEGSEVRCADPAAEAAMIAAIDDAKAKGDT